MFFILRKVLNFARLALPTPQNLKIEKSGECGGSTEIKSVAFTTLFTFDLIEREMLTPCSSGSTFSSLCLGRFEFFSHAECGGTTDRSADDGQRLGNLGKSILKRRN